MKIKCEYCNNYIDESEEKCPSCGAPNKDFKRNAIGVPTTIEELKQWYSEHNLPSYETTRFFIGINYEQPRAFGIYKDSNTGKFIVYKNKDTGERAIRYEGKDEKYAVNELYMKLKDEISNQKNRNYSTRKKMSRIDEFILFFSIGLIFLVIIMNMFSPDRGYYNINNREYYYVNGDWYVYDNSNWKPTSKPSYSGSLDDYYDGYDYESSDDYTDIKDSSVYDDDWDSSDWDSDSSWDSSDSWDSGGSDWSSDW